MIYFDQLAQQLNEGCGELNLYLMHVIYDISVLQMYVSFSTVCTVIEKVYCSWWWVARSGSLRSLIADWYVHNFMYRIALARSQVIYPHWFIAYW
jgi:hypothetical protein